MTSVDNGIGATTSVAYQPLNEGGGFYTNPRDDTYPIEDINGPIYVPQHISVNGSGTSLNWTYAYTELKKGLLGRGLLGFSSIAVTDPNGKIRTTTYKVDFPYVGLPISDSVKANGMTISNVAYTWNSQNGANANTHFVYPQEMVSTGAELNGTALPTVDMTTIQLDGFGNIQKTKKTITYPSADTFTSTTTNTYQQNTNPWIVNELTSSTVENTLGTSSDMTRTTTYSPEQGTGLVDGITVQPGDNNLELDIGYQYDAVGNPKSVSFSNPANNFAARQTQLDWGTGQFLKSVTNALSQQTQVTFDTRFWDRDERHRPQPDHPKIGRPMHSAIPPRLQHPPAQQPRRPTITARVLAKYRVFLRRSRRRSMLKPQRQRAAKISLLSRTAIMMRFLAP